MKQVLPRRSEIMREDCVIGEEGECWMDVEIVDCCKLHKNDEQPRIDVCELICIESVEEFERPLFGQLEAGL
jgi:hypothetical protein